MKLTKIFIRFFIFWSFGLVVVQAEVGDSCLRSADCEDGEHCVQKQCALRGNSNPNVNPGNNNGLNASSGCPGLPPGYSLTCQFTSGPRAGQIQSFCGYSGARPSPIGGPCTDGSSSWGVAQ